MKAKKNKSASRVIAELCGNPSIEKEVNARLKADRRKKKRTRIIIEHGNERYEVKFNQECMRNCAFVEKGEVLTCERACYLPMWFRSIASNMTKGHLKRIGWGD